METSLFWVPFEILNSCVVLYLFRIIRFNYIIDRVNL